MRQRLSWDVQKSPKISSLLDTIADRLEARGLMREALEIDKVADEIENYSLQKLLRNTVFRDTVLGPGAEIKSRFINYLKDPIKRKNFESELRKGAGENSELYVFMSRFINTDKEYVDKIPKAIQRRGVPHPVDAVAQKLAEDLIKALKLTHIVNKKQKQRTPTFYIEYFGGFSGDGFDAFNKWVHDSEIESEDEMSKGDGCIVIISSKDPDPDEILDKDTVKELLEDVPTKYQDDWAEASLMIDGKPVNKDNRHVMADLVWDIHIAEPQEKQWSWKNTP